MHTGQQIRTESGGTWFFDAGRIALDFAHTGGFADDPDGLRPRAHLGELLATPADLDQWLSEHTEPVDVGAGERELHDARELRGAIARLAVAAAPPPVVTAGGSVVAAGLRAPAGPVRPRPDDIDTVNLFAALPDVPPTLAGGRRRAGANRVRLAQALSSIARDAVALFTEVGFDGVEGDHAGRLSRCAAADCGLVFHDGSRGGTRRWCSMQRCGNREKVRAHRARVAAR
ncbi:MULTISPECIES: CGNR zinc finger domain-containing protein [unclassified Curtobacterium]|uniref:CGNR zinc finger domain-containing protein n=1 Tax=unclassified Curtobacterium TaxID=257496 RepID=UPI0021ACF4DB|nr:MULTISPECIES: CGNR zinc finger domain-containing protein [unclassified Curtobacterium]WIB63832.1 CGNR zinc finger domain-containing protein [Curtobacterium sp. MCBD17_040]WIB67673.1 CGNR zinc finger domain-containing protein [Curtobacterium sp. MCBD17_035]WIE54879.1 CGNR zinc finger domain-containing protein [Curtobacterium sp. MCBD17_003]